MAGSLERITQPIRIELDESEAFYKECLQTDTPLLKDIIHHIFQQKGKQLRPILILLSAALNGEINNRTYLSTSAIEMLHTATLVHDDIVDDAEERRGVKSVKAQFRSKAAVLVGDYLLAQALKIITNAKAFDLLEIMVLPIKLMSEGELIQIEKSRSLDITEDAYFNIINKKTAALIAASAATGAKSVGADDKTVDSMYSIGEMMGMAFQIRDDIFDYQKTNLIGKPTGNDIVERKITLPLIYALQQANSKQQKQVLQWVAEAAKDKKNVTAVRDFVIKAGGLDYAAKVADNYRDKALEALSQYNDCPARESLISLARYITERNK